MHQELREVNIYTAIIEAIALGNTRFNDIVTRTKIDTSKLGVYLKSLISLGIVLKEYSALSSFSELSKSNKALYTIKDNFFYFWYAFAYPNLNQLEHDDVEGVYEYLVKPNLRHFAAKTFENICIDYLYKLSKNNKTPFRITNAARWWGKVTKTEEGKKKTYETEIDILSYNEKRDQFILGECKFRNEVFSMEQFVELAGKNIFSSDASYYLFSLVGFQKSLIEKANKEDNIHLISLHDICK